MPLLIPPGMRAVSVQVDEVSDIAGFILPHAHVDILVAVSNQGTGQGDKPFSKIVLQNVEVLAVAQEIEKKKDEPELVKVVTVLVTPQDAERLALATREGVLHLAMRNYADTKIVLTSGTDVDELLHQYSLSVAPVMPVQHAEAVTTPVYRPQPKLPGRDLSRRQEFRVGLLRAGSARRHRPASFGRVRRRCLFRCLQRRRPQSRRSRGERCFFKQGRMRTPRTRRIRTVRRFLLRRLYQRMSRPLRPLWLRRARQSISREARRGDDEVSNNENTSW